MGIATLKQIIRAALKNAADKTQLSLIYANVTYPDILLKAELDNLAATHSNRFKVYYVLNSPPEDKWDGGKGFVTTEMIKERLPAPTDGTKILLCGESDASSAPTSRQTLIVSSRRTQVLLP